MAKVDTIPEMSVTVIKVGVVASGISNVPVLTYRKST